MVIPDGILTNSSLQYVRDQIESLYRIVAVVSMPQTAFAATGAGVKSSVLFLRKHSEQQTKSIEDLRQSLQDSIKTKHEFTKKLAALEQSKKEILKKKTGFMSAEPGKRAALQLVYLREEKPDEKFEIEDTAAYQEWKKEVSDGFSDQIEDLRLAASEAYEDEFRKKKDDYDIFMAIADDIGYDATGKFTKANDLEYIGAELRPFVLAIEKEV